MESRDVVEDGGGDDSFDMNVNIMNASSNFQRRPATSVSKLIMCACVCVCVCVCDIRDISGFQCCRKCCKIDTSYYNSIIHMLH